MAALIDVDILKGDKTIATVPLAAGQFVIGRDPKAPLHLPSNHISRRHAQLIVQKNRVMVVDAGSRNGVRIGGQPVKKAQVEEGQAIQITDFSLRYRWRAKPQKNRGLDTWDDYDAVDDDLDEGWQEAEKKVQEELEREKAQARKRRERIEGNIPRGSMLNRLAYQEEERGRIDEDEMDEDEIPPPGPALIVVLHEEANSLLYGNNHLQVGIEIIQTLGEQVHDVVLLRSGQDYWWGGRPTLSDRILGFSKERFRMVSHGKESEFRLRIPYHPRWKLFHRGARKVDLYRAGEYVCCDAEFGDQLEIIHGAYTVYVRCVRIPPPLPLEIRLEPYRPSALALWALVAALAVNMIAIALPMPKSPVPQLIDVPEQAFVEIEMPMPEVPAEEVPEAENEIVPTPPEPDLELEESDEAAPVAMHTAAKRQVKAPKRRQSRRPPRSQKEKRADQAGREETKAVPDTPKALPKPVSLDDFKIAGMIGHLPEAQVMSKQTRQGAESVLRGGEGETNALIGKNLDLLAISPIGSIGYKKVAATINRRKGSIFRCYETILKNDPSAEGTVEFSLTIAADGRLVGLSVESDEVGSSSLLRCLSTVLKNTRFPKPKGGFAKISYPLSFKNPNL